MKLTLRLGLACALSIALAAAPSSATVPQAIQIEGAILTPAGAPTPDGDYVVNFALYGVDKGGAAAWKEGPLQITVKNGQFQTSLGSLNPVGPAVFAALPQVWLGITFGSDPELPRRQLFSVPFSLRATLSEGVDCTGCIGAQQIDPKVLLNLAQKSDLQEFAKAGSLAKVAASGDYNDLSNKPKLSDVATTGQYGDLQGIPVAVKTGAACGTGLVMRGIKADGSYDCVAGMDASTLPKDAIGTVSNGLLVNVFNETAASPKVPVDIADALPAGVSDAIDVPDFGIAQGLSVTLDISNSDISKLRVTLFDPAGGTFKLYDQGGTGNALKATYAAGDKLVSGDISPWIGKNVKGIWSINVADLAGTLGKTDGKINNWYLTVKTISSKKVSATGLLKADGGLQFQIANTPPVTCNAANFGYTYASDKDKALYICNGAQFYPIYLQPLGTQQNPAASCKDILAKNPNAKDGTYWVNPGGKGAVQTYCDLTNNDGGWTLVARMVGGSWCHVDAAKVNALTSPAQAGCAKLSDQQIKDLYSDQFWFVCGTNSPTRFGKIDNIANFQSDVPQGNKKMTWSTTYGGATYTGTDNACCNFGDYSYGPGNTGNIYSIAKGYNGGNYTADWSGCYNGQQGWGQSGYLYVR